MQSEPAATPSETGFTVTLSAETWDRHIKHYRALTEQVRVLRELLHNAMAYIPNEYDDELALRNSIADALAALEGESQDTRTEALDWLLDWTRDQDGGDAIEHFHHINDGIAVHCGCPYQGEGALEGES